MNIYEALKSGRPFRQISDHEGWHNAESWIRDYMFGDKLDQRNIEWLIRDLQSDNFEVRQDPVPITPDEFWAAYYESAAQTGHSASFHLVKAIAERLNLSKEKKP